MSFILLSWTRNENKWWVLAHCFLSTLLLFLYVNSKHCVQLSYEMGHVIGKIPHLFCADPDTTFSKKICIRYRIPRLKSVVFTKKYVISSSFF